MNARRGKVRMRRGRPVQIIFERHGQRLVRRGVRPRHTGRRHHARAQLPHYLFPLLGVIADRRQLQLVQHQARGLQFLVMTGDAILVEHRPLGRERSPALPLGQRGGLRHRGHDQHDSAATHVSCRINKVLRSQGGAAIS